MMAEVKRTTLKAYNLISEQHFVQHNVQQDVHHNVQQDVHQNVHLK